MLRCKNLSKSNVSSDLKSPNRVAADMREIENLVDEDFSRF